MGLINRLIGNEQPKVIVHAFPKAYDMYERDRITLSILIDKYHLTDFNQDIAQVFPATNKLGMSFDHGWIDGDAVQVRTTGTPPGGIELETLYFIADSNPSEGTVKLSTQPDGTPIVNLVDEGTGTHTLYRIDPDLVFWGKQRRSIDSNAGVKDQELRRRMWDEMAEGIFQLAEGSVAFVDEQQAKDELEYSANYLDAR